MYQITAKSDRLKLFIILLITGVFTLVKALSFPDDFAETHWLFSYEFGFIKRGLPGEILRATGLMENPDTALSLIQLVSATIFLLLVFAIMLVIIRMMEISNWSLPLYLMVLLFISSSFIVLSGNLIGYFDHIFQLLIIPALVLVIRRNNYLIAGLIISLALFVHESILFVGFPVILLAMFLKGERGVGNYARIIVLPVLVFIGISLSQYAIDKGDVYSAFVQKLALYDFILYSEEIVVPLFITSDFFAFVLRQIVLFPHQLLSVTPAIARALPFCLLTLIYLHFALRHHLNIWRIILIALTMFLPLLLFIIAWDIERIWMYPVWHAFLILWVISELFETEMVHPRNLTTPFLLLFITHLLGSTALMVLVEEELELVTTFQSVALILVFAIGLTVNPLANYIFAAYAPEGDTRQVNPEVVIRWMRRFFAVLVLVGIWGIIAFFIYFNINQPTNRYMISPHRSDAVQWEVLRGKSVIIHFWDTDCEVCVDEISILLDLYNENRDHLYVMTVNLNEPWSAIDDWVDDFDLAFPVDGANRLAGNENADYEPITFIFDPDGELLAQFESPISEQQIRETLAPYLPDNAQ